MGLVATVVFTVAIGGAISAFAELPSWIRNIDASSALEAAFFRMMSLPNGAVAFRRPPSETRPALTGLIKAQPRNAVLRIQPDRALELRQRRLMRTDTRKRMPQAEVRRRELRLHAQHFLEHRDGFVRVAGGIEEIAQVEMRRDIVRLGGNGGAGQEWDSTHGSGGGGGADGSGSASVANGGLYGAGGGSSTSACAGTSCKGAQAPSSL